ncbi:hypothetical protein D1007_16720 [Hordeum vulgare]|nr:hypothetical protein D1007_16720 [Hordeum vulgare]
MLPPAELVAACIPGGEGSPAPQAGEVVVITEHFTRRFGLPASDFFSGFLAHFGLQTHHPVANVVLQLAAYVTLCKGFLGIEPRMDLWCRLFFFKHQSVLDGTVGSKRMTDCSAALVHHRTASGFPKLPLQESVNKWQNGFFYMKNIDPKNDYINMPPFTIATKLNCKSTLPKPTGEVKLICAHLELLKVAERVNLISSASMDEGGAWAWGKAPYDRDHPTSKLFDRLQVYCQPAADLDASDPEEIEDVDEVEPRPAGSEEVEDVAESEGTESAHQVVFGANVAHSTLLIKMLNFVKDKMSRLVLILRKLSISSGSIVIVNCCTVKMSDRDSHELVSSSFVSEQLVFRTKVAHGTLLIKTPNFVKEKNIKVGADFGEVVPPVYADDIP